MTGLLVCAPLGIEARALRATLGPGPVVRTGFGPARSAKSAAELGRREFSALVVAGLAGGVGADLHPGDVVAASEVRGRRTVPCSLLPGLWQELLRAGLPVRRGPVATVDHVVRGRQRDEHRRAGALAVDMESAELAAIARGRPLAVLRVVVDTAEQPLLSVGTPLRALRALSTLRTIGTCLRRWAGSGPDFVGDFSSQPPEEVL